MEQTSNPRFLFMKKIGIILILLVVLLAGAFAAYYIEIGPVNNDSETVKYTVKNGSTFSSLSKSLKESNLIKSELFYKVYVKLNKPTNLQAGQFNLSKDMGVKKIIEELSRGTSYNPDVINITFKEGLNMTAIAKIIAENTNNTEKDVYSLLDNTDYLDSLISNYWFINSDIEDKNIYYSLEGYLFPDTYQFLNKNVTVKDIFKKMLDKMNLVLTDYKEEMLNNDYTIHELLTLASMVELEAKNSTDRALVAGIFYNRLDHNMVLGSDVTTYYGAKVDLWSDTKLNFSDCSNKYNTRCNNYVGLPVGPISNPSLESIKAVLNPTKSKYYYFVADCKGKVYYSVNISDHNTTISDLKAQGLWGKCSD